MSGRKQRPPTIGVVAGVGPFAGLDLLNKIALQTVAQSDQEHLAVVSISEPATIPDRTAFLSGRSPVNPAGAIVEQLCRLEQLGATAAGIPCNTAHARPIMTTIEERLAASGSRLHLLNMIHEVGHVLQRHYPLVTKVGILSTIGTNNARVYPLALEPLGFEVLSPDRRQLVEKIHPAIYDRLYGIKALGRAAEKARLDLLESVEALRARGAQAIILGCTELPLALPESGINGLPLIDSTLALARALIRAVDPPKLRPFQAYTGG